MRGARLRGFFSSNQTHSLQSVFSRSVEHIFLLNLFGEGVRNVPRPEPRAGRVPAPVNRVGQRAARCPEDPASAPFGGSGPSALAGKRRRRLILPRVRLASPCARARQIPAARSSVGSPGVRTPRRLPLPGRSPVPTLTRPLRTSPPTCSLLLTSSAAGTMGWGCHSNQTGRHNPGMCAAPPPCRRASGAAAATLGGLRDSGCGVRWAERPGFAGSRLRRPRERGVETGGWRFGGVGGAGGRHLLAEAASPAARARPAAHGLRLAPRPAGGGAPTSPPPRAGHAGPTGHRGGAAAAVRRGDGERGRDVR